VVATVGASENDPAVALVIPNEIDPYGADSDDAHFVEEPKGEGEDPIVDVLPNDAPPNGFDVGVVLATKGIGELLPRPRPLLPRTLNLLKRPPPRPLPLPSPLPPRPP